MSTIVGARAFALTVSGALLLGSPVWAQAGARAAPSPQASPALPALEEEAFESLQRVQAFLQGVKAFELTAEVSTQEVYNSGQKIQFGQRLRYRIQRPDQLRLDFQSDLMTRRIFFNGSKTVVSDPGAGFFAQFDKTGTIKDLFESAEANYGIELPLADMFLWGDPAYKLERPASGFLVGPAMVGTDSTQHYAFRKPGIDFEIWILEGDVPLPVKIAMTNTEDPAQPQYVATLRWNLKPTFKPEDFVFAPGPQDVRIQFRPPLQAATAAATVKE